jgi:hypothetical protein
MIRSSACIKHHRLGSALAAVCLGLVFLSPASVPAQGVPSDPARMLDDLARKQAPVASPAPTMSDQPAASPGRQPGLGADELSRLGLAPIDPALLPKLEDVHGDASPGSDSSVGATLLAAAAFVLGVFVLGRVLR